MNPPMPADPQPPPEKTSGFGCPFCESNIAEWRHRNGYSHFIRCVSCGAQTSLYDTKEMAIAAWNRRPNAFVADPDDAGQLKLIEDTIHRCVRDDPDHDPSANTVSRRILTALRDAAKGGAT